MLFTNTNTDKAYEKAMRAKPNFDRHMPEMEAIQQSLNSNQTGGNSTMFFRGNEHKRLYEQERSYHVGADQDFCAVLYLLTADSHLWRQVEDQVSTHDVRIGKMYPQGLSAAAYLFFKAAKEIVTGNGGLTVSDISDRSSVSLTSFRVLCTALAMKGFGVHAAEWNH